MARLNFEPAIYIKSKSSCVILLGMKGFVALFKAINNRNNENEFYRDKLAPLGLANVIRLLAVYMESVFFYFA